jgi:PAS domain S-box-containing protein
MANAAPRMLRHSMRLTNKNWNPVLRLCGGARPNVSSQVLEQTRGRRLSAGNSRRDATSTTVKTRLGILIGTAVFGIIVLLALLVRDISAVYKAADLANEDTIPSIETLGVADRKIGDLRVLTWQHIGNTDPKALKGIEDSIEATHSELLRTLDNYQGKLISNAQDLADLKADREALADYDQLRDNVLKLSRAGQKDAARNLLWTSLPTIDKLVQAIDAHKKFNSAQGQAARKEAAAIKFQALALSPAIGLVLLAALGFIGFRTTRWLRDTLGGEPGEVADLASAVASGNLSNRVNLRPGDRTSLLAAVAQMQTDLKARIERERTASAENDSMLLAIGKAMATAEFGLDGTMLTANANFLQMMGYSLEELRGRPHTLLMSSADANGPTTEIFWRKLVSGQHDAGQYRRLAKGGREVWLQATFSPILDASGQPLKIVQFATDVTEHVRTTEEVRDLAQNAAEGNLTQRIPTQGKTGNLLALSEAINSMADGMASMVSQIRTAVSTVRHGTDEISKGNADLSQRTEMQASSLEETASSMEEMTSTVKQTADNAAQANQLAAAARSQAEKGGQVVSEAVAAMTGINDASARIADIIGVIDEIAFQTNLLALNAAVEAARAGEQGRGFAVVAGEVRTLAQRSATAAKEIKSLIEDSVTKVEHGSKLVSQSGRSLSDIVTAVKRTTDIVAEIAAACREQASGIDQVNKAVTSLDQMTQQNAALVEEASTTADSLSQEAQNLDKLMSQYQIAGQLAGPAMPALSASKSTVTVPTRPRSPAKPERRAAGRPWVKKPSPPAPPPQAAVATASSSNDGEWTEF